MLDGTGKIPPAPLLKGGGKEAMRNSTSVTPAQAGVQPRERGTSGNVGFPLARSCAGMTDGILLPTAGAPRKRTVALNLLDTLTFGSLAYILNKLHILFVFRPTVC